MSKRGTDSDNEFEVPIVVDAYGIKVTLKSRPDDLGEQEPSSWRDVPSLVNRHLIRIAASPTRLIAEVLEGATRLVRGLSRIPGSVANRMQSAHTEADSREQLRQELANKTIQEGQLAQGSSHNRLTNGTQIADKAAVALTQIQSLLQKYSSQGVDAYVALGPNGKIIIVIGTPPGSEAQVREAIE